MKGTVALGADHAGFELKDAIAARLRGSGVDVLDLGTHSAESCDYADYGHAVAAAILDGRADRGILVCGTGVGIGIAANRHAGIRAVTCSEPFSAKLSRQHNDSNVLSLGARVIGVGTALDIVDAWLRAEFEGGRHTRRVEKIERAKD